MDQLARRRQATLRYHAFELRPGGAPIDARKRELVLAHWPKLRERTLSMGLPISDAHPPLGVDTRAAHVAHAVALAIAPDRAAALHDAIFRAYWVDGRDIGARETLLSLAGGVGLDEERVRAALDAPESIAAVVADEAKARALGIAGVPQVLMNGYLLPSGMLPPEALDEAAAIVAQREPREL